MTQHMHPLYVRFPPSDPCSCDICTYFCHRPGWPLVEQARLAIEAGYGASLMLELSSDRLFGVLAPAFTGNEGYFALQRYASKGCTFLDQGLCTIHAEAFLPLECRYCHHDRLGSGMQCHQEIARDWHTSKGIRLIRRWLPTSRIPPAFLSILDKIMLS